MTDEQTPPPPGGLDGWADDGPTESQHNSQGDRGLLGKLFSTHTPDRAPRDLETEYDLSKGKALFVYGLLQMAETGGIPAIGNMALGAFVEVREQSAKPQEQPEQMPEGLE